MTSYTKEGTAAGAAEEGPVHVLRSREEAVDVVDDDVVIVFVGQPRLQACLGPILVFATHAGIVQRLALLLDHRIRVSQLLFQGPDTLFEGLGVASRECPPAELVGRLAFEADVDALRALPPVSLFSRPQRAAGAVCT